jgi:hypothetical protein
MKNTTMRLAVAGCLAPLIFAGTAHAQTAEASLLSQANAYLDAYVAGNWGAVSAALSSKPIAIYGSDLSEFATSREAFKAEFDADQALWRGGASLGETSQVSEFHDGPVATLFFTREFKIGGRTLPVRFATVWHLERGQWKLVESSNAVPTVGQSAAEILKGNAASQ